MENVTAVLGLGASDLAVLAEIRVYTAEVGDPLKDPEIARAARSEPC